MHRVSAIISSMLTYILTTSVHLKVAVAQIPHPLWICSLNLHLSSSFIKHHLTITNHICGTSVSAFLLSLSRSACSALTLPVVPSSQVLSSVTSLLYQLIELQLIYFVLLDDVTPPSLT